ncbi:mRNA export factor Gle1 [Drosophila albomicans]|uniref:mRNA export factor GLE1 n=1 Tax=Drosophila albomicans TaxID=7291 RepID=A0A6P8Z504_DROAB|nr:mRNA export factor Gle1 [Drosophila albomicans]
MSVDDLVRDQARLLNMQSVLQHAAIASITCTGPRSLGPDRKPLRLEIKQDVLPVLPVHKVVTQVDKTPPGIELIETSVFPDANIINASIVKRELAEECKRSVKLQLQEIKERQQSALNGQHALQRQAEQNQFYANSRVQRKENDKLLQQQAEQLAKSELEAQQREQQALLKRNNQKLLLLTIEAVSCCHSRFCGKYEKVAQLLLTLDTESVQACAAINQELRELAQQFDQLVGKLKCGTSEALELNSIFTAEQYCQNLDKLEVKLHQQLTEQEQQQLIKAKQQAEEKEKERLLLLEQQRQKKQEEQQQQEQKHQQELEALLKAAPKPEEAQQPAETSTPSAAAPAAAPPTAATATATSGISTSYVHPTRLAFYNEINALYQSKVDAVKPLQTDEAWKKYRTNCQRTINVPLNAITASSPQHLTTNFDKLYNFFAGQPVRTMDGSNITINDHPLARDYCILLMAKKFVSQTDTAISSNPQAAFPFASVINTFWKLLPDFGKIFLAYMYKESPYLVPYVIPQQPDQTPEQYLKTMGYRLSDNNELEKPDMFLKRQTGIARLYAAVIMTPSRKIDGPAQCFGLDEAWRWLTHITFVKPLPDICATMIMEMLQTLGFELWRAYGTNFLKLLVYIQTVYIPQLAAYDEGGPKTRLEMLLSKFLRERQIPQAVGVLPPGFW